MTDPISGYGRHLSLDLQKSIQSKTERKPVVTNEGKDVAIQPEVDRITSNLTDMLAQSEPPFDRAKVDRIKQAIQEGQYAIDPKRIAENFVAIERMIK